MLSIGTLTLSRMDLIHKAKPLFLFFILFISSFSSGLASAYPEKSIVIVIPSYNNSEWYQNNLDSVLKQKYENYRVIYLDDASKDGTGDLVQAYLNEKDSSHRVTLIQNHKRVGAMANIYKAVWMCDASEIIVTVDGDDWLYNESVLQVINEAYADPNVWLTYGQYTFYPEGYGHGAQELPQWVIENAAYRNYDWVTTHLRTFYAGLFQKIQKEDLLFDGNFFPVTCDLGHMFPMLEMAGIHSRFIPDVLYIYNIATPLSDNKVHLELQLKTEAYIRAKKRYSPIEKETWLQSYP